VLTPGWEMNGSVCRRARVEVALGPEPGVARVHARALELAQRTQGLDPELLAAAKAVYQTHIAPVADWYARALGDGHVELRVRQSTQRAQMPRSASVEQATPREAEVTLIEAANEIDMRFSGEYDHSGRPDELGAAEYERDAALLRMLGAPGMAETLRTAMADRRPVAPELQTKLNESYRLGPGNRPVKMAGGPV